ncbi:OadG family protein [Oscillibacter sp. 1-3]|uniref:OadG family protein n=1 Tax=Oscillibacter sp. 1-3 TaxID=1235797 RepID=UPI000337FFD1|nr:OadG family protein [Oscillibacter sp. 1-3]EOS67279.1 sodium pump decarboxylase, gamma subunit [Oscillibacter sp. 1-3]MCI9512112.1 OadG family protein [Oscillibacter sp.]
MEYSNLFVCLMGMGTVFFGLICLIVLTTVMGKIVGGHAAPAAAPAAIPAAPAAAEPNRQELVAAVSAAIAEELGTDITGIRIVSMKKL